MNLNHAPAIAIGAIDWVLVAFEARCPAGLATRRPGSAGWPLGESRSASYSIYMGVHPLLPEWMS